MTETPSESLTTLISSVSEIRFSNVDKKSNSGESPVRLCNYTDVYNNDYITADMEFMGATASKSEIARFGLVAGDVVITKDSETPQDIGVSALIEDSASDLVCGYHLAIIRVTQSEVDPIFLAKQLSQARLTMYFAQQANGSTRYGLPTAAIERTPLWLPPIEQQRDVGRIARLVDVAIEKTAAVIVKLKQVRAGLLHDLLTRGLDENGELRDPASHRAQFGETTLGTLPVTWDVLPLGSMAEKIQDGTHFSPSSTTGPRRYITSKNVRFGFLSVDDCGWISEQEHRAIYGRCDVRRDDVLLTKDGANTGNAALNILDEEVSLLSSVAFIRCRDRRSCPRFVLHYLLSAQGQKRLKDLMSGNAITRLTLQKIRAFTIPHPSFEEQVAIAGRLDRCTNQLAQEQHHLRKLSLLKSGLMNDLFSGHVRVPEPVEAEATT